MIKNISQMMTNQGRHVTANLNMISISLSILRNVDNRSQDSNIINNSSYVKNTPT